MQSLEKHLGGYLTVGRTRRTRRAFHAGMRAPGELGEARASQRSKVGLHITATQVERGQLACPSSAPA